MSEIINMRPHKEDKDELVELVKSTHLDEIQMVEVGCYAGASTEVFAGIKEVNRIWCVDPWQPGYDPKDGASFSDFSLVEKAFDEVAGRHPDKIVKFKGTFRDFVANKTLPRVDLVYIDACHKYECVVDDIRTAASIGAAFICGHDTYWDDVKNAVRDVLGGFGRTFRVSWACDMRSEGILARVFSKRIKSKE